MTLLFLLFSLFTTDGFAQNPCDPTIMAEMPSDYARLYYSVQCIEIKQRALLENRDELDRFLSGSLLNEYKDLFRNVIRYYPRYERKCFTPLALPASEMAECKSFNDRLRDSPYVKNDSLHILLLINDLKLIQEWVEGGIPLYDLNKMNRFMDLQSAGRRFTYAEVIAGDKNATLQTLQYFDGLGLLDPTSDESYPLHNAAVNNKVDNMKHLVARGWNVNAKAVKPIERYLKPKDLLGAEQQRGTIPLTAAIINKSLDAFKYLLSLPQIDVNTRQLMLNSTALMVAADGAFFDNDPNDPYFWALFNHPSTDLNATLSESTPQTVMNLIASKYKDPKTNPGFGKMIQALGRDPRLDIDQHCNDRNGCIQGFLPPQYGFPYDSERFEDFEGIIRKMNPEARGYNLVKTKNLTLQEYVDILIDENPAGEYRRELKRIRRCINEWIGTERSH